MINLIDVKDLSTRKDGQGKVLGITLDAWLNQIIRSKLELGRKTNELIYTNDLRGIGKTYELIHFAKKNDYIVIVNSNAESLSKEYNYNHIYNENSLSALYRGILCNKDMDVVIDELVNIDKIKKETNFNIVTGFVNNNTKHDINKNIKTDFNSNVVDFLKEEEELLRQKANKMLEQGDMAMYTKLINAYETVIELIKKYDWQLMYSEYSTTDDDGKMQKEVAVWEQNGDGQIRNHKVWNIEDKNNKIHYHTVTVPSGDFSEEFYKNIAEKVAQKINSGIRESGTYIHI